MARLPLLRLFSLAIRQLLRDARAGELRVLFFALVVAVAASTAIGYFGARLNGAMMLRATEFLGADLLLEGSSPARPEQIKSGTELGLEHAQVVEFSSVIATDNGIQLSSIKAADDVYPLRGELKSAPAPFAPGRSRWRTETRRSLGRSATADRAGPEDRRQHRCRHENPETGARPDLRTGPCRQLLQPDATGADQPQRPRRDRRGATRQPGQLPRTLARQSRGAGNLSSTDQTRPGRQPAHPGCPRRQPADRRRAGQGRALLEHGQSGGGAAVRRGGGAVGDALRHPPLRCQCAAALPGSVAPGNHGAVQFATDGTRTARQPQRRPPRLAGAAWAVRAAA